MRTVTENLTMMGSALLDGIEDLVPGGVRLRDINADGGAVFIGHPYSFPELSLTKRRLQSRLIQELDRFIALVRSLLSGQPKDVQRTVDNAEKELREIVEQQSVWHATTDEARAAAKKAIADLLQAVSCLHDPTEGSVVLVPDTNALVFSPSFQEWVFDDLASFEILLAPTLLAELDSLKIEHRNPDVRHKAQQIILQIKEYRRRGSLKDGVTVVKDRIRLRSTAVEPHVREALPWLDPTSNDDRMLASCIEAMRAHPRSVVALVTRDINLQNKAEFGGVPFLEQPPEKPGV